MDLLTTGMLETRILRAPNYQLYFHLFRSLWGEADTVNGWSTAKRRVHRMRKTERPGGCDTHWDWLDEKKTEA